jgi:hypothetical protein
MRTSPGSCAICMGKGMRRIRGTPGGRQFKTGSRGFALACGPYPGFAARYRSAAHACNGGSFGLNVMVSRRSIHTPSSSCACTVVGAPVLPGPSRGRAEGTATSTSTAAPIRIETLRIPPTLPLPSGSGPRFRPRISVSENNIRNVGQIVTQATSCGDRRLQRRHRFQPVQSRHWPNTV